MLFRVVVVRDAAAGAYAFPYCVQSIGAAMRSFADEVNRAAEDNPLYKHPEDFELFELGTFDTELAQFDLFAQPRTVLRALDAASKPSLSRGGALGGSPGSPG